MPPEKLTRYQQLIGTLLYASIGTCPDIAFAVTRLSRYNTNPTDEHHKYAQYILKYLKGTIKTRIHYDGSSHAGLIGYSDSDWGENKDDRHCQIGIEISDYTGDKISVGVAGPSHVLGQSVPCDR